jgi:hypothetical protein
MLPLNTHGVVELLQSDLSWSGVLVIDDLVGVVPEVTSVLFDVDNRKAKVPIAARRGMPPDKSDLTTMLSDIDYFSETWITPEEVLEAFTVQRMKAGWAMVFGFMNTMAELYGKEKVRLVVWFT